MSTDLITVRDCIEKNRSADFLRKKIDHIRENRPSGCATGADHPALVGCVPRNRAA